MKKLKGYVFSRKFNENSTPQKNTKYYLKRLQFKKKIIILL